MMLAPIALFVYNRLSHTKATVEALVNNDFACESEVFVYSDGPKSRRDEFRVNAVREYLKDIRGFKNIKIIEREINIGLAANILEGVSQLVSRYGKVIVLEDDLVTSRAFLSFMNKALEFYKDNDRVMHISGYMYPIDKTNLPDTFFMKPSSSWGWATWARAWKVYQKRPEKQINALTTEQKKDFNVGDTYDYFGQILLNYKDYIDTWAIFWYLSIYINGGLCLYPRESLVRNAGFDSSGTHCGKTKVFDVSLDYRKEWEFSRSIQENPLVRSRLEAYYKKNSPSLFRKIGGMIKRFVKSRIKWLWFR